MGMNAKTLLSTATSLLNDTRHVKSAFPSLWVVEQRNKQSKPVGVDKLCVPVGHDESILTANDAKNKGWYEEGKSGVNSKHRGRSIVVLFTCL